MREDLWVLESLWYHPRNFGSAHSHCLPQVLEIVKKLESRQRGWEEEEDPERKGTIVFNATSEFCRTLGEIPTYGLAGNREEQEELMDFGRGEERSASGGSESEGRENVGWSTEGWLLPCSCVRTKDCWRPPYRRCPGKGSQQVTALSSVLHRG